MGIYLCGSVPLHQPGETVCECVSQVSVKGTGAGVRMDKVRQFTKGFQTKPRGNVDSGTGCTQEDTLEGV